MSGAPAETPTSPIQICDWGAPGLSTMVITRSLLLAAGRGGSGARVSVQAPKRFSRSGEILESAGDRGSVAGGGALVEEIEGQRGETRLSGGIGVRAGADRQHQRDERDFVPLDDEHRKAVGELQLTGHRRMELNRRTGGRQDAAEVLRSCRSCSSTAASTSCGVWPACTVAAISISPPSRIPVSQLAVTSWAIFFSYTSR